MTRQDFKDDCAGAVAEEHASGAVLPIEDARERFGADDERTLAVPRAQEIVRRRERVSEARAHRLQVEGKTLGHAKRRLNGGCCRRERKVWRGGCEHDEIDIAGIEARVVQGIARRGKGEIRGLFALRRNVARLDAGPLGDPLVVGVHHAGEIGIRQDFAGKIRTTANYYGSGFCH